MLRWLKSLWAWEVVRFDEGFEVERNTVTGAFRHRGVGAISGTTFFGPWISGKPTELPPPNDLDEVNSELEDVELVGVLGADTVQQSGLSRSGRLD